MRNARKFEIHYYLDDGSHSMNAFIKNKCEAEFLEIVKEISKVFDISLTLEAQALEEGGIREIWKVVGNNASQITLVLIIVQILLSFIPTKDKELVVIQDEELIALQKEDLRLSIQERKQRIEKAVEEPNEVTIKEAAEAADLNYKIIRRKSNFYKSLQTCKKISHAGFSILDESDCKVGEEKIVERQHFSRFILEEDELKPITTDDAVIDIVAPVLTDGRAKWKGIYNGEHISFDMNDLDFKHKVLNKQVSFRNGTQIVCVLTVRNKLNEAGEVTLIGYTVNTVLKFGEIGAIEETSGGRTYKQAKKMQENQGTLFSE